MTAIVELDLFSGLPNLVWTLSDPIAGQLLADIEQLDVRSPGNRLMPDYDEPLGRPRSGYRGISVEFADHNKHRSFEVFGDLILDVATGRVLRDPGKTLERRLYESAPASQRAEALGSMSYAEVTASGREARIGGIESVPRDLECPQSPQYRGAQGSFHKFRRTNNCYNYATKVVNQVPAGAAIPGTPNIGSPLTMAKLKAALVDDKLQPLGMALPDQCPAAGTHYIAVLLRKSPGGDVRDFHCLRLDSNGIWSHKDGKGAVRNVDDNGTKIVDLASAALSWTPELAGFYLFLDVEGGRIN